MLEIKKISKIYQTEGLRQVALDNVSINFRKSEFASILGPSGSGKTTLLNIIGGLDHYDSGDLIINEVSTKKYTDRDFDSYRNHRIGFVFQSYNLIGHQSILKNVELALTLSGVSKRTRVKKAKEALTKVGLKDHINKRPNQLSGGQMQRVAIARALVNNPDIILLDEPTGALDSETSKQIMELLKEIASDKLIIMVTHNPELAEEYSNRIIKLKDGHIVDDSNPYDGEIDTENDKELEKLKSKKTSMNLITALSLSLNNLLTKKGRTFLTAFAGSIGIIGIALILSLSNGVQTYIDKTEKETLASYPLSIESTTMDLSGMMDSSNRTSEMKQNVKCEDKSICTYDDITTGMELKYENSIIKNNLKDFKKTLDSNYKNINKYSTDIGYSYKLDLQIYSLNNVEVNPNNFKVLERDTTMDNGFTITKNNPSVFSELINDSKLLEGQYDVMSGRMPENYNELVLVVEKDNSIPLRLMYTLDFENRDEMKDIVDKSLNDKNYKLDSKNYKYEDIVGHKFKLLSNTDYHEKQNGLWINKKEDSNYLNNLIKNGIDLEIVGILKVSNDAVEADSGFIGYTHSLMEYVINNIKDKDIAKEQLNNNEYDINTQEKQNTNKMPQIIQINQVLINNNTNNNIVSKEDLNLFNTFNYKELESKENTLLVNQSNFNNASIPEIVDLDINNTFLKNIENDTNINNNKNEMKLLDKNNRNEKNFIKNQEPMDSLFGDKILAEINKNNNTSERPYTPPIQKIIPVNNDINGVTNNVNISKINESIMQNHYNDLVYDNETGTLFDKKTNIHYELK